MRCDAESDEYITPESAWDDVLPLIARDKVIWDPFFCDGGSDSYFRERGHLTTAALSCQSDFFTVQPPENWDVILTNPPFSLKRRVLQRVVELGKPSIVLLPLSAVSTRYFREIFPTFAVGLLFPHQRTQFRHKTQAKAKRQCAFFSVWVLINFPRERHGRVEWCATREGASET